jgi:hypothetical protein
VTSYPAIDIRITPPLPSPLLNLFQRGVLVEVELGFDVLSLLRGEFCLSEDGIAKIQTIFWQGKPVDDLSGCHISDGGILALSAALPGLVGACLRRDGAWAALRDSISHSGEAVIGDKQRGFITVRLFNFMMREVGPLLLARGVVCESERFVDVLDNPEFSVSNSRISLDDQEVSKAEIAELLSPPGHIMLRVSTP